MISPKKTYIINLIGLFCLSILFINPTPLLAQDNQVYVITGAHQDLAGEKNWMMYANQLKDHIELIERMPDARFCMGNTFGVKHFLSVYPEYKDRLKKLMRQNKISSPAEWVDFEPDWYSGEFLVRSIAYAKYWLESEVAHDSHWAHLNDTPSLTQQFAQILNKSDVSLLVGNNFRLGYPPVSGREFYYSGLDGSDVLIYMTGYNDLLYFGSEISIRYLVNEYKLPYKFGPLKLKLEQAISDLGTEAILSKGVLNNCNTWNKEYAKKYNFSMHFKTIEEVTSEINKRIARNNIKFPRLAGLKNPWVWAGEAYGQTPARQRATVENMLPTIEKLASINELLGIAPYPNKKIDKIWEHILWPPDHNWGWKPKIETHKIAYRLTKDLLKQKMQQLADNIKWEAKKGVPIIVFNPLNWVRDDFVKVKTNIKETLNDWVITDYTGKLAASQEISSKYNGDGTKTVEVLFRATDIPAMGYKTFYITGRADKNPIKKQTNLSIGDNYIENKFYKISANKKDGITSIYDKQNKEELLNNSAGYPFGFMGLTRYKLEQVRMNIKNIDIKKGAVKTELNLEGLLFKYPAGMKITLYADSPKIDIDVVMDYEKFASKEYQDKMQPHIFIMPFKLDDYSMRVGVPYGSIPNLRPTRYTNTKLSKRAPAKTFISQGQWPQKFRFELSDWNIAVQKWFNIGDNDYSIDVAYKNMETRTYMLGNNKKLPAVHLLQSLKPQKYDWHFVIRPHMGDWKQADSPRFGWEASNPLLAAIALRKGTLPHKTSFMQVDGANHNVVLTTFKKAFDNNGYVLRFYETKDEDSEVKIRLNPLLNIPKAEVSRINMVEKPFKLLSRKADDYSIPILSQGIESIRFFKTAMTDVIEPDAINDLKISEPSSLSLKLNWHAAGDDGKQGTADKYEIAYSTKTINLQNWNQTAKIKNPPKPKAAGSIQSLTVSGLSPHTTYYFVIRAIDETGNKSALSNIAQGATEKKDNVPPGDIIDLSVTESSATTVSLSWSAPGDDKFSGKAAAYDLRYLDEEIDISAWEDAIAVTKLKAPKAAGVKQQYTISALKPDTTYYFAIKSVDEADNYSSLSNIVSVKTRGLKHIVLQNGVNGYKGCIDTYLSHVNEEEGQMVYGEAQTMRTWAWGARPILVKFNLSSLPEQAKINKAVLRLYCYDITYADAGDARCYRITQDWNESANWRKRNNKHNWNTKGGGAPIDRKRDYGSGGGGVIAKSSVTDGGVWVSFTVTPAVSDWMDKKYANYGFLIQGNCNDNCGMYYHSSEYKKDISLRPVLEIEYDPGK